MKFKKNKSISINEPNDINIKINTTTKTLFNIFFHPFYSFFACAFIVLYSIPFPV